MAANRLNTVGIDDIQGEQLEIYAAELADVYALLRSRCEASLVAEERLRDRGTRAESLEQVLSAAFTYAQLMEDTELPFEGQRAVAGRVRSLLERALGILQEHRMEMSAYGRDDLGLAALLRQELDHAATECGWDTHVETDNVSPSTLTSTTAWLVAHEALQRARLNPRTRRVTLAMKAAGEALVIRITAYDDGTGQEQSQGPGTAHEVVIRLYARLSGGSCRWRTGRADRSLGWTASEMELTLPLGTPDPGGEPHSSPRLG